MTLLGRRRRWLRALALLPLLLAACDTGASDASPTPSPSASIPPMSGAIVNAQLVAGIPQRLAVGIVDPSGIPIPDAQVTVVLQSLPAPGSGRAPQVLAGPEAAPYKGAGLEGKGVYVVHQTFDHPGFYTVLVTATRGAVTTHTQASFQVLATDPTPAVGSPAPRTQNPTAAQADIATLDTGVPPDDMHYVSVAGAIAAHHVTVIFFGSPGFCMSKLCAPEVNVVKSFEPTYRARSVDFVHIETYRGGRPDNPDLGKATVNPFFDEWHLTSDPWVFVVDRQGNVAAKFDGPAEADEITPVLDHLLGS
jgi:hypothetical protein